VDPLSLEPKGIQASTPACILPLGIHANLLLPSFHPVGLHYFSLESSEDFRFSSHKKQGPYGLVLTDEKKPEGLNLYFIFHLL
jgi:hypothetical protein